MEWRGVETEAADGIFQPSNIPVFLNNLHFTGHIGP